VEATVSPERNLQYRSSKNGGVNWTNYQEGATYNWTDLEEETTYNMVTQVKATHEGASSVDTIAQRTLTITTPADQAKIYRYQNGKWQRGKAYLKVNGEWVKVKKLYVKINGEWKIHNND